MKLVLTQNSQKMKTKFYTLMSSCLLAGTLQAQVMFQNNSWTPSLVTLNSTDFPGVSAYSLFGSRDTLSLSPGYRFGGSADGAGLLKNADGTYTLVVNHEDNFAVSRLTLDNTFKVIKGQYLLNSNAGMWRLCSATMATPEEHGFGPYFLTCGESGVESMTHYINPNGSPILDSTISAVTTLAGFGRWSAENAVPLPLATYPGQTVILIGDDDSGVDGGQLAMFIGNSVGDINNGRLYVLRRVDQNQREKDIPAGSTVAVEFVEIPNYTSMTGAQINNYSNVTLKSIKFNRVEDIDYRKGSPVAGREIYFNATGANNADTVDRTCWGRVYRLNLNANDPLHGTLELVINGDDKSASNPYRDLYQPDNICVTEDYVYVQEDPNGYSFASALPYVHDARIYQYDIQTGAYTTLLELDHHRHASDSAVYNRNSGGTAYQNSGIGSWEYGAMVDISKETGVKDAFFLCLQPHTWRYPEFSGVDGGTLRPTEKQGSQLITLTGVPRVKVTTPVTAGVTICSGEDAVLTASGGTTWYQTNGTTYKWYANASGGSALFTGSTFTVPAVPATVTFYVSTLANGEESNRVPVTITVNPRPQTPTVTVNGLVLTSSAPGGNQWYRNGLPIPGATGVSYTAFMDGFYAVQVTENGCTSALSGEHFVLYSVGVEEQYDLDQVSIFPNPNDGLFTLKVNTGEASQKFQVQLVDLSGRVIYTYQQENFTGLFNQVIDLSAESNGVYLVNIATDTKACQRKIVKQ